MKLTIFFITALLLVGCTTKSSPTKEYYFVDMDCGDFGSHWAAQSEYEDSIERFGSDVHGLDGDNDGIACEGLR